MKCGHDEDIRHIHDTFSLGVEKVLDHIVNNYQFNWVLTFLWFTQEKHISLLGPGCGTQCGYNKVINHS